MRTAKVIHLGIDYAKIEVTEDGKTSEFEVDKVLGRELAPILDSANTEYNGWSNYATWRINLEMLDHEPDSIRENGETFETIADLADYLEQMVDDSLDMFEQANDNTPTEGFNPLRSYADAFVSQVNWREIAENIAQDNKEFIAHGDTTCPMYREPVLPNEDGRCSLCDATLKPETAEVKA